MKRLAFAPLAALALTTATASAADPVATARATLTARDPSLTAVTLSHRETLSISSGRSVVRFVQLHGGVPVIGRGAAVLLDAAQKPTRLALARTARDLPAPSAPAVDATTAAQTASRVARVQFTGADGVLAWLPAGRGARLVWTFHRAVAGLPYAPALAIDASTGRVMLAHNAVQFDRAATVHTLNPITTPQPSAVVLDALAPGATSLQNEQLRVQNCIDEHTLSTGKYPFHACVVKSTAVADAQGDFPYVFDSDTAQEDEYAEVAMFYHASKAYAYFTGIGMPELVQKPLDLVVNLRLPAGFETFDFSLMSDTSLPLEPYNNAFFAPENPFFGSFGPDNAGLWFGQGVFTDFAYDGDVVYHEFGHAMADRTIQFSHYWHLDSQGATVAPGAMNEGLADYFSSAISGDGEVGEYAAQNFSSFGLASIRNLDNDDRCPDQLAGEVHMDSTLFSGGLWSVRKGLDPTQQKDFDSALMTALVAAPSGDVGYEDVAQLFVTALEASPLGKPIADLLAQEFTTRGVLPGCTRIIEYADQPLVGPFGKLSYAFVSPGTYTVPLTQQTPFVPGLFQVHAKLEANTAKLRVSIEDVHTGQPSWGEGQPFEPALLVRFDGTPIEFSYDNGYASSNAGEPIALGDLRYAEIEVPDGATELHLMVVNLGDEDGYYTSLSLYQQSAPTNVGGSAGKPSTGGAAGVAGAGGTTQADDSGELSPGGGCACRSAGSGSSSAGLWLAALAAAALSSRRRRR